MNNYDDKKLFVLNNDIDWTIVDKGVRRKIMAYDNNLMVVKVAFDSGGIGSLHKHPHSQITHIESGEFEVEINGVKNVLKSGDVFLIPPHALHGAVCLKEGVLIDVFSPMREDFIEK